MKHLIAIADLTPAELAQYLSVAKKLKAEWRGGGNQPILKNKTLGMVFQKPSLRTRVSFDMGMLHLGGHALYLSPKVIDKMVESDSPKALPTSRASFPAMWTASWRVSLRTRTWSSWPSTPACR